MRDALVWLRQRCWGNLLDSSTAVALANRAWQLLAAPVTILLIAGRLSAEQQGYYYTFGSLVALQSFFELGFGVVVINVASHEWARLALDGEGRINGDADALS